MNPLRVLLVEDSVEDAARVVLDLERAGFEPAWERVADEDGLADALARGPWDVVVASSSLSPFDPLRALAMVRQRAPEVPFIVVSTSPTEEAASRALQAGADDFVPKQGAAWLTAAVGRELREAALRRDRARAMQDLQASEDRFRLLVEGVRDYAMVMLDQDGRVASWNEGVHRILGYEEREILGEDFARFYVPEDVRDGLPQQELRTALVEGRARSEARRTRKDGARFFAESLLTAVRDPDGRLRGFALVIGDASARRRAEEERTKLLRQLEEAVRARDDFLAIASHELKTPLTSLQLQVQTLLRLAADERVRHKMTVVARQVDRMNKLVTELLDISRIARGRLELEAEDVDLGDVVTGAVARLEDAASDAGSEIVVHLEDGVHGRWDRFRVEQVVTNLLSNAIKYGQGRPVVVGVVKRGDCAVLSVQDHGIGIQPSDQARIFKRFERAVSENAFGGFGMGLWIVRQIVEAHGGTIRVQSQRGRGSTFVVEIPLHGVGHDRSTERPFVASVGAGR